MYSLQPSLNPSNWLRPAWIIVSFIMFKGLLRYGYREDARRLLAGDLDRTGTLHEFSDPDTGEPIMNPGFLNWNMLAVTMAGDASIG